MSTSKSIAIAKKRDIILITSPNSSGKTTAHNIIATEAMKKGYLSSEAEHLTDIQCLIEALKIDDNERLGQNHLHEKLTHPHNNFYPEEGFDFIVTGNVVVNDMYHIFWTKLAELPYEEGKVHIAELTGGVNFSKYREVDHSYSKVKRMLENADVPKEGLNRILAVLYIEADWDTRISLNKQRTFLSREEIRIGKKSAPKPLEILLKFRKSDFYESGLADFLSNLETKIYHIKNNGEIGTNTIFSSRILEITREIFCYF